MNLLICVPITTYSLMNYDYMTEATCGAGTAYPSGTPKFTHSF